MEVGLTCNTFDGRACAERQALRRRANVNALTADRLVAIDTGVHLAIDSMMITETVCNDDDRAGIVSLTGRDGGVESTMELRSCNGSETVWYGGWQRRCQMTNRNYFLCDLASVLSSNGEARSEGPPSCA